MANENKNYVVRFVHIHDGAVTASSDKGMELLGNFFLSQVGTKGTFFKDWLHDTKADTISSHAYVLQKEVDQVILEHAHADELSSFITTAAELEALIDKWESLCKSRQSSACTAGGSPVVITNENGSWCIKTV